MDISSSKLKINYIFILYHNFKINHVWCPQVESNYRPLPYHGSALPTELCGPIFPTEISNLTFYQLLYTGLISRSLHNCILQSKT